MAAGIGMSITNERSIDKLNTMCSYMAINGELNESF